MREKNIEFEIPRDIARFNYGSPIKTSHRIYIVFQYLQNLGYRFQFFGREKWVSTLTGEGMRPYQNTVPNAVHLSIKSANCGRKNLSCLQCIENYFVNHQKLRQKSSLVGTLEQFVDQTVRNLSNPDPPYCQKCEFVVSIIVFKFMKTGFIARGANSIHHQCTN
jgi:type III restriction enzyme